MKSTWIGKQLYLTFCNINLLRKICVYFNLKATLRVLSNPAVLTLLKIICLLLKSQSNNVAPRSLTIPVLSHYF
jgi:hypothetical protein